MSPESISNYDYSNLEVYTQEDMEEQQERFDKLIERVENYPCCMSCYITVEEMQAGKRMKENILRILKGDK